MKRIIAGICIFSTLLSASCKKDYINPSAANEDDVFTSTQAVTAVAVGLQRIYSSGRSGSAYNLVTANGFSTKELLLRNQGNIPELQLSTGGGSVDGTNTILGNLWANSNKIIFDANRVITYAKTMDDKAYASGLIAYATMFKALAMGNMSICWTGVPDTTGNLSTSVPFIDRMMGFNKAIGWIDEALAALNANPPSAAFRSNIPDGIDLPAVLLALKARYALFTGKYDLALNTAQSVTRKAVLFKYDPTFPNPIWETATSTNNVFQVIDSSMGLPVGLQPDDADKRVDFYMIDTFRTTTPRFRIKGYFQTNTSPIPVYTMGELTLIKAEAYARKNDLVNGLIELNKVVTKTAAQDTLGLGADLPPIVGPLSQEALLTAIYKHRCIELYMSGLKLEDMRRFNRPNTERKRNFYPYPFAERDNNPNTPADPDF